MTIMRYLENKSDLTLFKRAARVVGARVFKEQRDMYAYRTWTAGVHLTDQQLSMFLLVYPLTPGDTLEDQFNTFTYELGNQWVTPDRGAGFIISDCFGIIRNPLHIDKNNQFFITSSGGDVIELGDKENAV